MAVYKHNILAIMVLLSSIAIGCSDGEMTGENQQAKGAPLHTGDILNQKEKPDSSLPEKAEESASDEAPMGDGEAQSDDSVDAPCDTRDPTKGGENLPDLNGKLGLTTPRPEDSKTENQGPGWEKIGDGCAPGGWIPLGGINNNIPKPNGSGGWGG